MKVGDLVKFTAGIVGEQRRRHGIIVSFDEDSDPVVLWLGPGWDGYTEANFRTHIEVLSRAE